MPIPIIALAADLILGALPIVVPAATAVKKDCLKRYDELL